MRAIKDIVSERREKRDLAKRIAKLENTVNTLQVTIDIALDSRVSYLETKFVELKRMKPVLEKMTSDISDIKTNVGSKRKEPDENRGIEIA